MIKKWQDRVRPNASLGEQHPVMQAEIDELRAELESDHAETSQVVAAFQVSDAALRAELAKRTVERDMAIEALTADDKDDLTIAYMTGYSNGRRQADAELAKLKQGHTRELCPTCGEDEPFTGSCGTSYNDTKALCKRAALPHAHSSELKPYQQRTINILEKFYPPALDDRREGLGAHHVYCRAVTEDV